MASTTGIVYEKADEVYKTIQDYYGRVLSKSGDLKTSACTTADMPRFIIEMLRKIPRPINDKYYGCGSPLPAGLGEGLTVLDLGSGSGRDCYLAAAMVGPSGSVIGVDMTAEQLATARAHVDEYMKTLGYPKANINFVEGYIEFLEKAGIKPESVDLIISNCVINLSPDKKRVLAEAYKALRYGGELYFSDVYSSRRLSKEARHHSVMLGECLGGALYVEDFKRICREVGFVDPRQVSCREISVVDPELCDLIGEAKFYSITFRCFKLMDLEWPREDYGQIAVYKGGIKGHNNAFQLDDEHRFEKNRPMRVCGSTAAIVGDSWLRKFFDVIGNRNFHFGPFVEQRYLAGCGTGASSATCSAESSCNKAESTTPAAASGGCGSSGSSCCPK